MRSTFALVMFIASIGCGGSQRAPKSSDTTEVMMTAPIEGEAGDPKAAIQRVIRGLNPAFLHCYDLGLTKDPTIGGSVNIVVQQNGEGDVTDTSIESLIGLPKDVVDCLSRILRGVHFPPPPDGKPGNIVVPLSFAKQPAPKP
jgi:hypothetical protein